MPLANKQINTYVNVKTPYKARTETVDRNLIKNNLISGVPFNWRGRYRKMLGKLIIKFRC